MKVGDKLAVSIEGVPVAEAVVEDIEDGNATLIIPATRLIVKIRQTLDLAATKEPEVDRVFAGLVEGTDNESAASAEHNTVAPEQAIEEAPAPPETGYNMPGSQVGEGIHGIKRFPGEMD